MEMEVLQPKEIMELPKKNSDNLPADNFNTNKIKNDEPENQPAKKSKEEKRGEIKKKDDRTVEQVLKALSTLGTSEEKLAALCKKYADIVDENRKLQLQIKQSEKRNVALQREKEQLQSEQSKAILTRSRLENLCRELQRQNKAIKEESLLKIREEEEKRKVVSAKFQTALGEITGLMQQNNENNSKLRDENLEMQNKFKTLCEQYELREQQVEKMSKQMQLESQLADVKLAKVKIDMFAEKELLANEKEQLLVELTACQNRCQEMQKTEAVLRNQISMYTEKYDEFQSALAKSNQIYAGFKSEMEKMSKKMSKLEKETSVWKMKWEGSHKALLQMAAEKQQRDADLALTTRQLNQLQKLCRTLQSERTALLAQLKPEGQSPKVGAANEETASIEKLTSDESDNLSHSDGSPEISNLSVHSKKGESKCLSDSENKLPERQVGKNKEVHESQHYPVENSQKEEVIVNNDKDNSNKHSKETKENDAKAINNKQSSAVNGKQVINGNQSEASQFEESTMTNSNNENNKQDQNCTKSNSVYESKKGKDASRKKKKCQS